VADDSFQNAATGLALLRSALVCRIVIVGLAIAYAATLIASPQTHDSGGFGLLLGFAELATTVVALVGAARFASRAPDGVAGSAGFAPLCLGVAILVQVYSLWITWQVFEYNSDGGSGLRARDVMALEVGLRRMPYLAIGSAVAALLAMLSIIGGIASVARALSRPALVQRAHATGLGLFVFAVLFSIVQSWSKRAHPDVVAAGVVAAIAIALLVAYVLLLGEAIKVMRYGAPKLPVAHVITGPK